ncbi:hypothetical protein E2C01_031382 [Portunus trituberculatus]|uniref:Uncharacterized protein n=1 Tax=Portunus trituberculatus TaxID=210409 RepID=A0A5B7EXI9_PORTR|nr:hypothetical protein [Portunus trituberculatus]
MNAIKKTLVSTRAGGFVEAGHSEGGTLSARRQGQPLARQGWRAGRTSGQGDYYTGQLKTLHHIHHSGKNQRGQRDCSPLPFLPPPLPFSFPFPSPRHFLTPSPLANPSAYSPSCHPSLPQLTVRLSDRDTTTAGASLAKVRVYWRRERRSNTVSNSSTRNPIQLFQGRPGAGENPSVVLGK